MRMEEAKKLKKGDHVRFYKKGVVNYKTEAVVLGVYDGKRYGKATFDDIVNGNIFKGNGRRFALVQLEYTDVWGDTFTVDIDARYIEK